MGSLPLIIAIIALGISILSLYTVYTAEKPLTVSQKVAIAGIADDLKTLQNKDVSLYAPVQTKLTLNNTSPGGGVVDSDIGWGGDPAIEAEAALLGAFSWGSAATPDSALLESLAPDNYTAQVAGAGGDTGLALVEVYDATPAGTYTPTTPRLVNLSALIQDGDRLRRRRAVPRQALSP